MRLFRDTSPLMLKLYFERLRAMTIEERSIVGMQTTERVRETAADGVRSRHPDYDEATVQLAVTRLMVGEEVFKRFFPDSEVRP